MYQSLSLTRAIIPSVCIALGLCNAALAQGYTLRPLPATGDGTFSRALGLHESGPVVGTQGRPVRWIDATPEVLALPVHPQFGDVVRGSATDVDAGGRVVGVVGFANPFNATAFVWQDGTGVFLPLPPDRTYAESYGISGDTVVGYAVAFSGNTPFGWVPCAWDLGTPTPTLTVLPTLGGPTAAAFDINANDEIVGWSIGPSKTSTACVWREGKPVSLGTLGGPESRAWGINAQGQIVGDAQTGVPKAPWHAFLRNADSMIDLGALPGFARSIAMDVNNSSEVVGWSYNTTNAFDYTNAERAFVWKNGTMTNLNSFLPAGSGWTLVHAWGIDNLGRIAGWGRINGQSRGYLLVPCEADFNADGATNSQDFFDFIAAFFDLSPTTDFNHDGDINSQDFFDFLAAFFVGC